MVVHITSITIINRLFLVIADYMVPFLVITTYTYKERLRIRINIFSTP